MNTSSQRVTAISADQRKVIESQLLDRLTARRGNTTAIQVDHSKLSPAEESLWFFDQLKKDSPLYNITQAFRLRGPVDIAALEKAFQTVVDRHENLRSNFCSENGKPIRRVRPQATFRLETYELSSGPKTDELAQRALEAEGKKPFNLERDLLLRALLIRTNTDDHYLSITLHHIVGDFTSLVVLYREVSEAYNTFAQGKGFELSQLKVQYSQWLAEFDSRLHGHQWDNKLKHWKEKLAAEIAEVEFPTDRRRPAHQSFAGAKKDFKISRAQLDQVRTLARSENSTVYLTLLAAFEVLLHRYTGQEDIIVGTPLDLRNTSDAEKLIGFFVNTLPLRTKISAQNTVSEAMKEVRNAAMDVFIHKDVPFDKLVEMLQVPRQGDRNPLFQLVFQYLPAMPKLSFAGVEVEPVSVDTGTSKFDLTFTLIEDESGLVGEVEFNTELLDAVTVDEVIAQYLLVLESVCKNPQQKVCDVPLLGEAQLQKTTVEWNATTTSYPRQQCVHQLFEEQANLTPGKVAVRCGSDSLTYDALNQRANQLAHRLREAGVTNDSLVGIVFDRSINMIIALLGILKAGGAYVPIDPAFPQERVQYIADDTKLNIVVTEERFKMLVPTAVSILLDDAGSLANQPSTNLPPVTTAESLAYVMYTSGSTGKPKGVLIPHRGIVRLVKETNYAQFSPDDVFAQFATISFDASTFEIWGALLNGATLAICPPGAISLEQLGDFLVSEQITTLWLTAGLFHQMVDHHIDKLRGVRQLLAGGDVLAVPQVLKALRELPACQLINGYGPTENTTFTCCYRVSADWNGTSLPIGKPISNTQVYILDEQQRPVPIGVPGELYVGGDGLARAYLNAPELTTKKFVVNPFGADNGPTLYRTGDRVRWLPNGDIEFIGRFDNQVKVRGFRVELGEVESALSLHPDVRETTVIARQNCVGKELVAYFVPKSRDLDSASLRKFVQQKLPPFMVPAHFVKLDTFPLTTNGKIDRRKLPAPEKTEETELTISPRNSVEQQVHSIWCEVLGRPSVSIRANFFELGGHSLIATQIISRASRAFGRDIPLHLLFECPTIEGFSAAICINRGEIASQNIPIRKRAELDTTRLDQLSDAEIARLLESSLGRPE